VLLVVTAPIRPGQKEKLRVRIMYNEYQDKFFNRLADEFEQKHPEIDVVIERVTGGSWTDFEISLLNDYWNGTPPDVARISDGFLTRFIEAGLLETAPSNVTAYLDAQPIPQSLKDQMKRGEESYGVIHGATWQSLFYNKEHFREVGLDPDKPPKTLDELVEYAKKLTIYDENGRIKRAGLSLRKSGYAPGIAMKFFDYYFSMGGEIFSEDKTECLMNSEIGVQALQFFLDCLYKYKIDGFEVVGDFEGFANGTVSMMYRDPWAIKYFYDNKPDLDYGISNICSGVKSSSNGGFYPYVVAKGSKYKDLAWEFVMYIMTPEHFIEYAKNEMNAPFNVEALKDPEFAKNDKFMAFLTQPNVEPYPSVPHTNEVQQIMGETIERVARTGEDPKKALDDMVAKINPLLKVEEKKPGISPEIISGYILGFLFIAVLAFTIIWWRKDHRSRSGYILIAPMFIYFSIFLIYPIISSLILSFWDYNPLEPINPFIGLGNYIQCLTEANFIKAFINTAIYSFWVVLLGTIAALTLAVILNRALEAIGLYRTLYFIPVVTSIMGAVLVWKYMYLPDSHGLFNMILAPFGIQNQLWLQNEKMALGCLIAMSIWKNMGFNMIIFLAGLKGIPDIYYEAASIDGASGFQKFQFITLPMLRPTILFVVVTSLIGTFQVFTQVVGMTEGGPNNATRTIVYHIYEIGFKDFQLGYASAGAVLMLIVVGIITWLQMRTNREERT
jgi:multiple sugar transport system permease protein